MKLTIGPVPFFHLSAVYLLERCRNKILCDPQLRLGSKLEFSRHKFQFVTISAEESEVNRANIDKLEEALIREVQKRHEFYDKGSPLWKK